MNSLATNEGKLLTSQRVQEGQTESLRLEGTLDLQRSTTFPLKNYFDEPVIVRKIELHTEPHDGVLCMDVKVGKNSQTACSGTFKASILNRLPPVRLDTLRSRFDFTLHLSGKDYTSNVTVDVEISKESVNGRNILIPVGKTQVIGRLVEVYTTNALFQAIEQGSVTLNVKVRPDVYPHQVSPFEILQTKIEDGCIRPSRTPLLGIGDLFEVEFDGNDAKRFGPNDVVGLLSVSE